MKLSTVILVLADLLLRGVAVPHAHAGNAADHAVSSRPHVHMTWDAAGHGHSHHHGDDGHDDHDRSPQAKENANDLSPSTPFQGHKAIFVHSEMATFATAARDVATDAAVGWVVAAADRGSLVAAGIAIGPFVDRPPDDRAETFHTLMPHVLRI